MSMQNSEKDTDYAGELYSECLPPWATGEAAGYLTVGAQLATRDGRVTGNAVVESIDFSSNEPVATILTDAGHRLHFNEAEMQSAFHPPVWTMDLTTAVGHRIDPPPDNGVSTAAVAAAIAEGVRMDEGGSEGFDVGAGLFGQHLSDAVRRIAASTHRGADLTRPDDLINAIADRLRSAGHWTPSDTGVPESAPFDAAQELTTLNALNKLLARENDGLRSLYQEATGKAPDPGAIDVAAEGPGVSHKPSRDMGLS